MVGGLQVYLNRSSSKHSCPPFLTFPHNFSHTNRNQASDVTLPLSITSDTPETTTDTKLVTLQIDLYYASLNRMTSTRKHTWRWNDSFNGKRELSSYRICDSLSYLARKKAGLNDIISLVSQLIENVYCCLNVFVQDWLCFLQCEVVKPSLFCKKHLIHQNAETMCWPKHSHFLTKSNWKQLPV